MQLASLEGYPLIWMMPLHLYLQVNQKSDYDMMMFLTDIGVRSAMHAASQPGRVPTDLDDAPAPLPSS